MKMVYWLILVKPHIIIRELIILAYNPAYARVQLRMTTIIYIYIYKIKHFYLIGNRLYTFIVIKSFYFF